MDKFDIKKISEIDWKNKSWEEIDAALAERIEFYNKSIERNGGKRPKREGFIVERIASIDTLRKADAIAQDGKVKINRFIRRHNSRQEEDLRALQMMILTLDFPAPDYRIDEARTDSGKVRQIVKQKYHPWRILHHAIMIVIGPTMLKHLIYDTFACIKGKGLHFGVKRLKRMLRRYPEYRYFVKTDYKKFYQSILHELIEHELRKRFKDEQFFRLIEVALFSFESGEELLKILEDEEGKKRCTHWRVYKSADQQFCSQFH